MSAAAPPPSGTRTRVLVLGAAGRDFHDFLTALRDRPELEVVGFTATQIPGIESRRLPAALAGPLYPAGLPVWPERDLERLVREHAVDEVVFAYSDVSHEHVMHLASRALAAGAGFRLLGPKATMLRAGRPVVSVCAARTGAGKSPTSRRVASLLAARGLKVAVLRHPMPYGDLARQAVQRFATLEDMDRAGCTIEEREEYEPHVERGQVVFAGVDYRRVLAAAESEADVLLWDGGNNDTPFVVPDLELVCVDPQRAGQERTWFPGEVNLLRAHVVVLTKLDGADPQAVERLRASVAAANPRARIVNTAMPIVLEHPEQVAGRRVLVVEDGPTVTHGGLAHGAGLLAARRHGAREILDPRPYAVGSLKEVYVTYPHIGPVLPAMGYGARQIEELKATIAAAAPQAVVVGTPIDLRRALGLSLPAARVRYEVEELGPLRLADVLEDLAREALARRG